MESDLGYSIVIHWWPTTSDQLNRASSWRTIQYQVLNVHYILQCYDNRSRYHARNRQSQLHDPGTLRIDEATKYIIPSGKPNLCFMNFVNYNAQPFKPQWFIGTPLMRQYCHFYDVSKQRLGFAIPKTKSSKK
ncbi:unnamed protein product, partial [Mesorhabditis belari]|uniref:Peptidase A1 domain-containing protein n=1 Tax=Mesorhabditis belari TaxID=2138241 RepID=A0AAF3FT70_9BILA